jgi:hypothetical protein
MDLPIREISISWPQPIHMARRPVHICSHSASRRNTLLQTGIYIECMSRCEQIPSPHGIISLEASLERNTAFNRTRNQDQQTSYHRTSYGTQAVLPRRILDASIRSSATPRSSSSATQPTFTGTWLEIIRDLHQGNLRIEAM